MVFTDMTTEEMTENGDRDWETIEGRRAFWDTLSRVDDYKELLQNRGNGLQRRQK